jgi:formate hydrogenlyase subunit 3/multisubunit Na+/H+ antiporter MnhD subunit
MSAPVLWVLFPALIGAALLPFWRRTRWVVGISAGICVVLGVLAWQVPLGTVMRLGPLSLQISTVMEVFGRRFVINASDRSFLMLMYWFCAVWIIGSRPANAPGYFPPLGLMMIALMVAAQAVEPFLYAALIIELIVLISLPLLSTPGRGAGAGLQRYLVFQTLAIPMILLAGWAAGLVEANPPGTRWVLQAVLFLGLGFSIWLAVFPFYTWMPLLAQETSPYLFGFILGLLPVGILFIFLGFLDTYSWLRDSFLVVDGLRLVGGIMILTAGIWAAFQTDLARLFGYAILLENGFAVVAISLHSSLGVELFAAGLIPRLVVFALWALALSVYQKNGVDLTLAGIRGTLHRYPVAASALALAYFSLGGLPLLASFPVRQPLVEALASSSLPVAGMVVLGNLGFLLGAYQLLAALVRSDDLTWHSNERRIDAAMLVIAMAFLILIGILPGVILRNSLGLVQVFSHLR